MACDSAQREKKWEFKMGKIGVFPVFFPFSKTGKNSKRKKWEFLGNVPDLHYSDYTDYFCDHTDYTFDYTDYFFLAYTDYT